MADETPSLDDTLEKAFEALQAKDAAPEVEAVAPEPVPEQVKPDRAGQARGPDGRFAPSTNWSAEVADPSKDIPFQTADRAEPVAEPAVASSAEAMPTSWSHDAKAAWTKLPAAVQQAVLKREAEVSEGFKSYSTRVKAFEPIEQMIQPIKPLLDQHGIAPAAYLGRLVEIDKFIRQNPAEGVKWIMEQNGLKPDQLFAMAHAAGATDQTPESGDPRYAQIEQTIGQLGSNLNRLMQAQHQAEVQKVVSTIEQFAASPGHDLLEDVRSQMAALIESGQAKDLQAAYDQAVWMNPATRAKMIEADRLKLAEEGRKRVEDAKRVRATNVRTVGTSGATPSARTLDETLNSAWDRTQAGAS